MVASLPKVFPLMESIKDMCLENIIRNPLNLEKHGKNKTSWRWFTVMFVASIYIPWKVQGIS
jgi:hypothetical protein